MVSVTRFCSFPTIINLINPGISVPVSNLPTLVYETKKDLAKSGIQSTIVGHVGDGGVLKNLSCSDY
jgi:FAD/FMN-containing dehydrogenase